MSPLWGQASKSDSNTTKSPSSQHYFITNSQTVGIGSEMGVVTASESLLNARVCNFDRTHMGEGGQYNIKGKAANFNYNRIFLC